MKNLELTMVEFELLSHQQQLNYIEKLKKQQKQFAEEFDSSNGCDTIVDDVDNGYYSNAEDREYFKQGKIQNECND